MAHLTSWQTRDQGESYTAEDVAPQSELMARRSGDGWMSIVTRRGLIVHHSIWSSRDEAMRDAMDALLRILKILEVGDAGPVTWPINHPNGE